MERVRGKEILVKDIINDKEWITDGFSFVGHVRNEIFNTKIFNEREEDYWVEYVVKMINTTLKSFGYFPK